MQTCDERRVTGRGERGKQRTEYITDTNTKFETLIVKSIIRKALNINSVSILSSYFECHFHLTVICGLQSKQTVLLRKSGLEVSVHGALF